MKLKEWMPFTLFVLFWGLYQATIAHVYSYDGVSYALDVEFGTLSQLFHPNHLLYAFLYRQFYQLFQILGYHGRAIYLMESLNAFVGAAAVAFLGWVLSRRFGPLWGFLAAIFFGISRGFWSEAIDPGCYGLAGLGAVFLLELLLETKEESAFRTGVLHGLVVLLHQMYILAVPAFIAVYFLKTEKGLRSGARYGLGVFVGAVLPYALAAHIFHQGPWGQELSWILTPAGTPPSGQILNGFWWTWGFLPNIRSWWETFAQSIMVQGAWSEMFSAGIVLLCVVWSFRQYTEHSTLWPDAAAAWIWILAINIFQFFFFHAVRYAILFIPPLLYIMTAAITEWGGRKWVPVAVVALCCMGTVNYSQAIAPRKIWSPDRARILWIEGRLRLVDFLLFQSIQNVSMAYFAPEIPARSLYGYLLTQYAQPDGHLDGLTLRFTEAWRNGGSVWVEKGLLDPHRQQEIEASTRIVKGTVQKWFKRFAFGRHLIGPDGYELVELKLLSKPGRRSGS